MADTTNQGTIEVSSGQVKKDTGIMSIKPEMMILTYVTFIITAIVLYKVAWKPILAALNKRENSLRKSVEEAEKIRAEMAAIDKTRARIIDEADKKARDIVDQARAAALETGKTIETKAREEAQILLENARREIHAEQEKAMAALRKQSAELAIEISRRLIKENLDETRSRAFADKMIGRI